METAKQAAELYLAIGAGGISLLVLIGLLIYLFRNIEPRLKKIEINESAQSEIMRQMSENMCKMNDSLIKVAETQERQQEMLESSQEVIKNNTQAYIKFSETLQELTTLIRQHNETLKDVNDGVKVISRDTARLMERVSKD